MKITGAGGYVPFYRLDEPGTGKLVNEERIILFNSLATIHDFTIDGEAVAFIHQESILGYLE